MISILGTTQILYTFFTLIFSIGKIVFLLRRIMDEEQIETFVFNISLKLFPEFSLNHTLKQIWIMNSDNVDERYPTI